jgi:hypothetical protein
MKRRLETEAQRRRHGITLGHTGTRMGEAQPQHDYFSFSLTRNVIEASPYVR